MLGAGTSDVLEYALQRLVVGAPETAVRCPDGPVAVGVGVVFVYAGWSGPSAKALRDLTRESKELKIPPPIRVVDIDQLPTWLMERRHHFAGWGDLLITQDGAVVSYVSMKDAQWREQLMQALDIPWG